VAEVQRVLITGGCGFIGSHFVRLLRHERPHWRLINVDKLTYAGNLDNLTDHESVDEAAHYHFVRADIAEAQIIEALFAAEGITAVINLAAETHVDRSLLDSAPFLRTNVEGTRVLLEAARQHGVKRFLQVSTDEVYGSLDPQDLPCTERSLLQPNSPYAASKAAADLLARAYHRSYDVPVVITRCGNNYGPYQYPEKFLPLCITNALEDQPLPLYGDGQQSRDWIHVEDHAQALLCVLESGTPGEIYNIGASQERTNQQMAEWLLDLVKKPRSLIRYVADRPGHDRRYALDTTKIRTELGWQLSIPFEAGLETTVAWYQEHRSWWTQIKSGAYRSYYRQWYGQSLAQVGKETS
jgi:dTDP-glucose 4,6-dehydratase